MSEPWFDPKLAGAVGGILGSACGVWGAVFGTVGGMLAPRGKGKGFVFGMLYGGIAVGTLLAGAGLASVATGQPWPIWYAFLLPGAIMLFLGIPLAFVAKARYRDAELRRMQAAELAPSR